MTFATCFQNSNDRHFPDANTINDNYNFEDAQEYELSVLKNRYGTYVAITDEEVTNLREAVGNKLTLGEAYSYLIKSYLPNYKGMTYWDSSLTRDIEEDMMEMLGNGLIKDSIRVRKTNYYFYS